MKKIAAIAIVAVLFSFSCAKAVLSAGGTIYDSDTNHLWNRLNSTLFERRGPDGKQYGPNQLDILYWPRTTNLLAGASHQQALAVLDEFINTHGEKLIQDPLKKALLQRDLWALFDWAGRGLDWDHKTERIELAKRLAIVIRRLELTTNEIASLPDNYALAVKDHLPELPAGLFNTNGIWINIRADNVFSADNMDQIVPMHTRYFGGLSVFSVWFRDPGGYKAGVDYLNRLSAVQPMFVSSTNPNSPDDITLNPDFPQLSTNSQWALARRMCVIDTDGHIQMTHVVESIQLRTYWGLGEVDVPFTNIDGVISDKFLPQVRFNEFQMTRDAQDQLDFMFSPFMRGIDAFENYPNDETFNIERAQTRVLETCSQCHNGGGIYSVNSFTRVFSRTLPPADETTHLIESVPERESEVTIDWKQLQYNWGLL